MIHIYCDLEHFDSVEPDACTIVGDRTADYVRLRQGVRRALDNDDLDLIVYLRTPVLAEWLKDIRDYGELVVTWQVVDAQSRFQQRFGFPPPQALDTAAIKTLGMLTLPTPSPTAASDPSGWLLGKYLGPVWEFVEPYPGHLVEFAVWAAESSAVHPSLRGLADERLEQWRRADRRYGHFVGQDLRASGRSLLLRWALRSYSPGLLADLGLSGTPLADATDHAKACVALLEAHRAEIGNYWRLFFTKARGSFSENVEAALSSMSGLSGAELEALSTYIRNHAEQSTYPLLDSLAARFRLLPDTQPVVARLRRFVPAAVPGEPADEWAVRDWLRWATEQYLPYFAWVVRNRQPRQGQARLSARFSDWFVNHYISLPFDAQSPLVTNQHSLVRQSMQEMPEGVLIWAIVDGLAWWQGEILVGLAQDLGLHAHKMDAALSTLPSITSVAKRAIARGYLGVPENQPIAQLLHERLGEVSDNVAVFSGTDELVAALEVGVRPGLYVLIYNALDAHNHESGTFTDDESAIGYLRTVASALSDAVRLAAHQGLEARVLISSDHGSTLAPKEALRLEPPAFLRQLDDEDELPEIGARKRPDSQRVRACSATRDLTAEERARLGKEWYILGSPEFGLSETLLIPKGTAYLRRRPRGWIHGGASPEEIVVPFVELRPQPLEAWPPELEFSGYLLPSHSSIVTISLANPNAFPLNQVRICIWEGSLSATLPALAAAQCAQVSIPVPAVSTGGMELTFDWRLTCTVAGRSCDFIGKATLPIRRLQVSQVDELFEELR